MLTLSPQLVECDIVVQQVKLKLPELPPNQSKKNASDVLI